MPTSPPPVKWIPLWSSLGLLCRSPKLLGWSFLMVVLTFGLTWGGYVLAVGFVDGLTAGFFQQPPDAAGFFGWIKHLGWQAMKWTFFLVTRIIAFYMAFLLAYTLSAPGYVFLSSSAEKRYAGDAFEKDAPLSPRGILVDILEGLKIGILGLMVTVLALTVGFIPIFGQIAVLLLYTGYSTLMFLDYPTSRRRWSLGRKLGWLRRHGRASLRLGVFPAVVSLVPIVNIFLMALLFPLFTVHTTLNFVALEQAEKDDFRE
jgi:CysZ protein